MFQVDDVGCQNYCHTHFLRDGKHLNWKMLAIVHIYIYHLHSFFLNARHKCLPDASSLWSWHPRNWWFILRSAGLSGLWCTRSPLRKCRQMKRYVFSNETCFRVFKQNIFRRVFEADFRISSNIDFFTERVSLHFGTILAWEVPFPPRHPFRPWPLKRAHLQLHNPMNLPPHAWDMWRDGASRRPPERWWDELRSVKKSCSKLKSV